MLPMNASPNLPLPLEYVNGPPNSIFHAAHRAMRASFAAHGAKSYSHINLGTLCGSSSYGKAINDHGYATGWSTLVGGETHAFFWHGTSMQDLGSPIGRCR